MRVTRKQLLEIVSKLLGEDASEGWKCPRCGTVNHHGMKKGDKCSGCKLEYDKKFQGESWELVSKKNESITRKLYEQAKKAKDYVCPPATQDVDINTENRNATREDHTYGPMNPLQPSEGYWESLAEKWEGATIEEAAGMRCGNCIAFDISPRMRACMPISEEQYVPEEGEEIDPMDAADMAMSDKNAEDFPMFPEGEYVGFGYCWMHHFKCHSARSCDTWAGGGPLESDEDSHKWQDKNKF